MTRKHIAGWIIGALLLLGAGALAGIAATRALDLPPADGRSLAALVESVERKRLGAIQSVEYEREWWQLGGLWEITVCKEGCLKLYLDPVSGEETRRASDDLKDGLPPVDARPSAIARSFEERKLGTVTEIEFEHGAWQVKYREARGLSGILKPSKRRVVEPA